MQPSSPVLQQPHPSRFSLHHEISSKNTLRSHTSLRNSAQPDPPFQKLFSSLNTRNTAITCRQRADQSLIDMNKIKESFRRLILKPNEEATGKLYEKLPLVGPKSSRLLTIQFSSKFSSMIECNLSVVNYEELETGYNGLSYCWGDVKVTRPIRVNNITFLATKNLVSALRHLRHDTDELTFWVDAICINQNDIRERSAKVQQMGLIYSQAKLVVCWLGKSEDNSDLAIEKMWRWGEGLKDCDPASIKGFDRINKIYDPFNADAWKAISALLKRPWWYRVWILQEFVLPQDVYLKCGGVIIPWRHLCCLTFFEIPIVQERVRFQFGLSLDEPPTAMYIQRTLHHSNSPSEGLWRINLLFLFWNATKRLATDPRDNIYGILGLIGALGQYLIQVHYSLSIEEIYTTVAR
jgi:hypothetical protein